MAKKAAAAGKKGKANKKAKGKKAAKSVAKAKEPLKFQGPVPIMCQSHKYPGMLKEPSKLAVLGLKSATYVGLCDLLRESFKHTDRALLITPWGPYVVFREINGEQDIYFLYDGCSCMLSIFRYYDLKMGTAGLLYFQSTHEVITYILENRFKREKYKLLAKTGAIDKLCRKFCTQGGENIYKICNRRGEICNIDDHIVREGLFPFTKHCDINSTIGLERALPGMKNEKLFKRVLEGKYGKKQKQAQISCK